MVVLLPTGAAWDPIGKTYGGSSWGTASTFPRFYAAAASEGHDA